MICLLSREQCCRLADEPRANGTFITTLLSYGTGLLLTMPVCGWIIARADDGSALLLDTLHYIIDSILSMITFITDEYCS